MKDINFIKNYTSVVEGKGPSKKAKSDNYNTICTVIICIFIASVIAITIFLEFKAKNLNDNLAKLENDIAALNEVVVVKKNIENSEKELIRRTAVIDLFADKSLVNTEILSSITRCMPKNLRVKSYSGVAEGTIKLSGSSKIRNDVAYFVYNLNNIGLFKDVYVSAITAENGDKPDDLKYNFEITIKIKR